jgi:hypothetical protein
MNEIILNGQTVVNSIFVVFGVIKDDGLDDVDRKCIAFRSSMI